MCLCAVMCLPFKCFFAWCNLDGLFNNNDMLAEMAKGGAGDTATGDFSTLRNSAEMVKADAEIKAVKAAKLQRKQSLRDQAELEAMNNPNNMPPVDDELAAMNGD